VTFRETALAGAFVIDIQPSMDERGFFARIFCRDEFGAHGLQTELVQCAVSFNARCGTLRGMHYQVAPHAEAKLVRCTMGALHDVILDLRPGSPTFRKWVAIELTALNRRTLYIPEGVAHGFQTLAEDTEVFYQMSHAHVPEAARGVRFDDPLVGIKWPLPVTRIAEKDLAWPPIEK